MKKNNIEHTQLSPGFRRMCMAGFFLHAAAYMPFPLLAVGLGSEGVYFYLLMLAGLFLSGPFNAYLGDACYRKSVFVWPAAILLVALFGYIYADGLAEWGALALIEGACWGLTSAAGVTLSIDVTESGNRTWANVAYARWNCIGMAVGMFLGFWLYWQYAITVVLYVATIVGVLGILEASRIHVPFRAPMGMRLCNLDRFILPRACLPALNVYLLTLACGIFASLVVWEADAFWLYGLLLLVMILLLSAVPLVRMFVRLSQHCQRGTSNTTLNLAIDAGMISGFAIASWQPNETSLYIGSVTTAVSVLMFIVATCPYYRNKRVR